VANELSRLERVGLIDDEAFTRSLVEHAIGSRGQGRRAVAASLAAKGVDGALAATVLDELAGDEQRRADQLARSRVARLAGVEPAKAFSRLAGFLARRGYPPEVARSAARRALQVDAVDG
jgi:regulatory protein